MSSISLVSLNIERSKHLDRVIPFLAKQKPDVFCAQELCEDDIEIFKRVLESECVFVPMSRTIEDGDPKIVGLGLFSNLPIRQRTIGYYRGSASHTPDFDFRSVESKHATENAMLLYCDVEKDNAKYRIGTTHFTWTPDGQPDTFQRHDLQKLIPILESAGEMIFCGDLNAPRGGEIFSQFASRYKDNIPAHYRTSLDPELHRAMKQGRQREIESKMVDGLFTTPEYTARDVSLVSGVSDHMAIVATVEKP